MKTILSAALLLASILSYSQNNVRAWYADGQVFIIWEAGLPVEESYAIYASPSSFSNTSDATQVGRPFYLEYLGYGLKENLGDTSITYRIPDGHGGLYQLGSHEGLFVFTPHQSGALYFSVNKWGENNVVAGQNITNTAVTFNYNPIADPVECHLQRTFPSPFTSGYICFAYVVWSDGRQNHGDARPDFPIMANAAKNGMPSLFLVSAPTDLDTTEAFPLSVWLHGGGGIARQSLAGSRAEVNINPETGVLVAHDDKMYGYRNGNPAHPEQPTWHFGYRKNYDPFATDSIVPFDTVINYTQRRYVWIDRWLARNFNIDTNRINIHGHSMGSAGSIALVKAYPAHYGSATIFNTGCTGPDSIAPTTYIFGKPNQNLPTNLKNRKNEVVDFYDLWDLYTNCAAERDIPLIRHWHGKNDNNGVMHWGPAVVENFRICDSTGTGAQNFWSERPHGMDMAPDFSDHWIQSVPANQQTVVDNVSFAEGRFRSNVSFPAFFNHRLDPKNNDPGTGLIGINNGDGDNWGTWGGYHRWVTLPETAHTWDAIVWLESKALFPNDNPPTDFLTADMAIRRPQTFLPEKGQQLSWFVTDISTGDTLQSGVTIVHDDGLVVIPQINVYKEDLRRNRITVTDGITAVKEYDDPQNKIDVFPNPALEFLYIQDHVETITIWDLSGVKRMQLEALSHSQAIDLTKLPGGIYIIEGVGKDHIRRIGRFVKL